MAGNRAEQLRADLTDTDIDNIEMAALVLEGAIILSSFNDKFEIVPIAGFGPGRTLDDIVPFDYKERRIGIPERKRPFKFTYIEGGEEYEGRFFTRLQIGKHPLHNQNKKNFHFQISGGEQEYKDAAMFHLNREIEGLQGEALTRKYNQLVDAFRSVFFREWKIQNRQNPTAPWKYQPRTVFGRDIKHEYVSYLSPPHK